MSHTGVRYSSQNLRTESCVIVTWRKVWGSCLLTRTILKSEIFILFCWNHNHSHLPFKWYKNYTLVIWKIYILHAYRKNSSTRLLSLEMIDNHDTLAQDKAILTKRWPFWYVTGWYILNGGNDTIPTHCVTQYHCGTKFPVWMKGSLPSVGNTVDRQGCIALSHGTSGSCCELTVDMKVRNCGPFYVYHLKPTPFCPSAYCVGKYRQK